jgi:hypothetical protein
VGAWAGVPSVRCPCQQVQQPKATLTENGKKMLARAQKINLTKEHTGGTAFQSEVRPALLHHGILALHIPWPLRAGLTAGPPQPYKSLVATFHEARAEAVAVDVLANMVKVRQNNGQPICKFQGAASY